MKGAAIGGALFPASYDSTQPLGFKILPPLTASRVPINLPVTGVTPPKPVKFRAIL